jgi:type IV secretory pathway VirB4 component
MGLLDLLAPGKKKRSTPVKSTQTYLRFGEIRDNTLVLKNGSVRAVLKTTSINFNLKSEQEQDAIIHGYQGFLNSLEFPIQILVKSKKLDIDDYIDQIEKLGEKQENKLLQEQTFEYAAYIKRLIEYADIMEKEFYVIVPHEPARTQGLNIFQGFFQRLAPKDSYADIKKRHEEFNKLKKQLAQKVNVVKTGLEACGLRVKQLETQGLIELFYNSYNPTIYRSTKLKDLENLSLETDEKVKKA